MRCKDARGVADTALNEAMGCVIPSAEEVQPLPVGAQRTSIAQRSAQSGVALRFPPHSRSFAPFQPECVESQRGFESTPCSGATPLNGAVADRSVGTPARNRQWIAAQPPNLPHREIISRDVGHLSALDSLSHLKQLA